MLEVGKKIPKFSLRNQDDKVYTDKDLLGKRKVIYFYPKDNTPGCTKEACEFTDSIQNFDNLGVAVYGVSPDSVAKHKGFETKYNLKMTLLADVEKEFSKACGVFREKSMYGKLFMGLVRTTLIVDENNKVLHVFNNVKVTGHVAKVLETLKSL
ncbi:putative peroxiredoxin bcp [Spirochaetota bacterium]|nr:putative peroxiredoxin bcp [Spirochaetota bacterium]